MSTTEIITLPDGPQVEVDIAEGRRAVATAGELATRGWSQIESVVRHITGPFVNVYKDLAKEASVSEISVDIGLAFEASGSIFVVKTSGAANLRVSIKLKPNPITPA